MYSQDRSPRDLEKLESLYEDRIQSLEKQVELFFKELEKDELYKAIKENKYSREFGLQRSHELFRAFMKSEQESTIKKLQNSLSVHCKKCKDLELENNSLRERLKNTDYEKVKLLEDKELERLSFEKSLKESSERALMNRKELDISLLNSKSNELLNNEIEFLKQEIKIRENSHLVESEDLKKYYEARANELDSSYQSLLKEFQSYQKQSEELAAEHQQVIKQFAEKTKKLKAKVLSQKSKIEDMNKNQKESLERFEKNLEEAEERLHLFQKNSNEKECDSQSRHRTQLIQLQSHYQEMMNIRLAEMQKDVDEQVRRSQDHDLEVRKIMELRLREIERDYILKDLHEKLITEKENHLVARFNEKFEESNEEHEKIQISLQEEISKAKEEIKEISKQRDFSKSGLEEQLEKFKQLDGQNKKLEFSLESTKEALERLQTDKEKAVKKIKNFEKELSSLQASLEKTKNDLASSEELQEKLKTDFQQVLLGKVEKKDFEKLQEKILYFTKELENKTFFISELEKELKNLGENLMESTSIRVAEQRLLESERQQHLEAKIRLGDLKEYSEHLYSDLGYKENENHSLKSSVFQLEQEILTLHQALSSKEKDVQSLKQLSLNKEAETRVRFRLKIDSVKKALKSAVFALKTTQHDLQEAALRDSNNIKKMVSSIFQEISSKLMSFQSAQKKKQDFQSNQISLAYKKKLQNIEESLRKEELHWTDPETEGIRVIFKSLIENKTINQIETRSLKEAIHKLQIENENLYNETKHLHTRFHQTMKFSDRPGTEILRNRLGSSYKDPLGSYRYN